MVINEDSVDPGELTAQCLHLWSDIRLSFDHIVPCRVWQKRAWASEHTTASSAYKQKNLHDLVNRTRQTWGAQTDSRTADLQTGLETSDWCFRQMILPSCLFVHVLSPAQVFQRRAPCAWLSTGALDGWDGGWQIEASLSAHFLHSFFASWQGSALLHPVRRFTVLFVRFRLCHVRAGVWVGPPHTGDTHSR